MPFPFLEIEGIHAGQIPKTLDTFSTIIKDYDLIIEIGSNCGGFTIWLYRNKNVNAELISLEVDKQWLRIPETHPAYGCIFIRNCFEPELISELTKKIAARGKTLVLCDGGGKSGEFDTYSRIIKPGDTIMLHDFADSPNEEENYRQIKEKQVGDAWVGGPETSLASVSEIIDEQNLQKYRYKDFLEVLWGSFEKKTHEDSGHDPAVKTARDAVTKISKNVPLIGVSRNKRHIF
jgi:hypothetical protein